MMCWCLGLSLSLRSSPPWSWGRSWAGAIAWVPRCLLILFGALLGLIPRFGGIRLDGEIVLLLFLPAILYWESLNTSFREIRANLRVIVFFSVGLVIATAVAVSWTARALGMESHAASVLGAVLSPTDAAAVAGPGETVAAPGPDRAARGEHHQRRHRARPLRRDRLRCGRWRPGQPGRPGRPFRRLLPRRYRRRAAGRRRGDPGAPPDSTRRWRKERSAC